MAYRYFKTPRNLKTRFRHLILAISKVHSYAECGLFFDISDNFLDLSVSTFIATHILILSLY